MTDRLTSPEFEPTVFKYISEPELHEKYIELTVQTGLKPVEVKRARLPLKLIQKRHIMIFYNDKQVSIPAWLCEKERLV